MKPEIVNGCELYLGDCLDVLPTLAEGSVDLTVTSPPYDRLREYNGYSFDFEPIARELYRVTKSGGVVVWVVGDMVEDGGETLSSMRHALYFVDKCGFTMHDTMIYKKDGAPFPESNRYLQTFEYMFVLSKGGAPKTHNLLQEKTKYGGSASNSTRSADGGVTNFRYAYGKENRTRDNVWYIPCGYMKTTKDKDAYEHPAMFPEALARDHIISWSNPGDVVLDPMMGSGTTGKKSVELSRKFVGCECSLEYYAIAKRRILQAQPPLFVDVPARNNNSTQLGFDSDKTLDNASE